MCLKVENFFAISKKFQEIHFYIITLYRLKNYKMVNSLKFEKLFLGVKLSKFHNQSLKFLRVFEEKVLILMSFSSK